VENVGRVRKEFSFSIFFEQDYNSTGLSEFVYCLRRLIRLLETDDTHTECHCHQISFAFDCFGCQ